MGLALRAVGSALAQVYGHLTVLLVANITAMLLSLPLLVLLVVLSFATRSFSLVPLGSVLLIGILPNPAVAGLQFVSRELATGEILSFSDHLDGLRLYGRLAIKVWLLSVAVTVVIVSNLVFYSRSHVPFAPLLDILWVYLLLTWLALHLYVFPLLIEQEVKRVFLIYRNALSMTVGRPFFTFVVFPIWLVVLFLGSATGLGTVIALALATTIQANATARLLPTFGVTTGP